MHSLIIFAVFLSFLAASAVSQSVNTCGAPDANGVTKLIVTASSPIGPINLYTVQFDTVRKLALTSTAMHNSLNHQKTYTRAEVFRMFECNQILGKEMNCSNSYKFTPAQRTKSGYFAFDRGHMVPANPNRFSLDALDNTFFCINMASQDPYVNREPWAFVESLALDKFKTFPGFVITGLCDANSIDGPTKEGYANPACYWKLVCYKEGGTGATQVVGFIADNSLVFINDTVALAARWTAVTTPRSLSEIELLTRPAYIANAWRHAASDLLVGRNEARTPNPESCIAAKTLTPANAIAWNNPPRAG